MVCFAEEFLCQGAPAPVFGPRHRFRAIGHISGIPVLHGQQAPLDASVIMNEILDPEFHPIIAAENDPEFLRHWFTGHGC
jgi:hypothetical protein